MKKVWKSLGVTDSWEMQSVSLLTVGHHGVKSNAARVWHHAKTTRRSDDLHKSLCPLIPWCLSSNFADMNCTLFLLGMNFSCKEQSCGVRRCQLYLVTYPGILIAWMWNQQCPRTLLLLLSFHCAVDLFPTEGFSDFFLFCVSCAWF